MWKAAEALTATEVQKEELKKWVRSGKTEQRVAFRCHIILRAISGESNNAIAKGLQISRPTVILWRNRFQEGGLQSLCEDMPRGRSFPLFRRKQ